MGCETAAFGQMAAGDGGKGDDLVEVVGGTSGRGKQSGAEQQQRTQEQEQEQRQKQRKEQKQRRRVVLVTSDSEGELMGGQKRVVNDRNGGGHGHDCGDGDKVSAVSGHCNGRRCDRRRRRSRSRRRIRGEMKPGLGRCAGQRDVNVDQSGHGRSDGHDGGRHGNGYC